jgi:hypothetical protein
MNIIEARKYVGRRVVNRARGPARYGILVSAGELPPVYVRYDGDEDPLPVAPEDIEVAPAEGGQPYPQILDA